MRIFVSYQTLDGSVAEAVAAGIKARRPNVDLFFAPEALSAGAYWLPRLAKEIEASHAVLFMIGKRIGKWQEMEYLEAVRLARGTGRPLIVPVVMVDYAPGLPFFNQYHRLFLPEPSSKEALDAIVKALDGARSEDALPLWKQFNPYRGLAAFSSTDSAFFFGREELTAEILTVMQNEPGQALALVGNSGVGKSSLAQAGIIAALRGQEWPDRGAWPAALADSRAWLPLTIRPEDRPLKSLTLTFIRLLFDELYRQDAEAEGWVQRFRDGASFADFMRAIKDGLAQKLAGDEPRTFLIYIDQGEELYASTEREGKPDAAAKRDAEAFSRAIAEAAGRPDCRVLFSLRSDYYGSLQEDEALFAVTRPIDVPPMGVSALRQAIERPAAALGVRFQPPEMPGYLAGATAREAGALPLLAYLLSDMWRDMQARSDGELRFGERPEVFDVSAALRERAERYRAQNKPREDNLRRLFTLRLAQVPRLGDVIKRRARRAECSSGEWDVAEELAGEEWRLVTVEGASGDVTAEVAHEQILRKWPALEGWLGERRDFLTWKAELEAARAAYDDTPAADKAGALLTGRRLLIARNWFTSHGSDLAPEDKDFIEESIRADDELRERARRQERTILVRTRVFAAAGFLLAFAAGGAGIYAYWQKQSAVKAQHEALTTRNAALLNQSQFVASLSEQQRAAKDYGTAALLALEVLPDISSDNESIRSRQLWLPTESQLNRALESLREQIIFKGHSGTVHSVAFNPDGTRIVTGSWDKTARLWDTTTGEELRRFIGHDEAVLSVAFSSDGARVLTGSEDRTARLWDTKTGKEISRLRGHAGFVRSAGFSPDGAFIVTGSSDKTARVWDTKTGKELTQLSGHDEEITSACFSSDGAHIATASYDHTARVWDARTGAELLQLRGHSGPVLSIAYSPDGALIVTGSSDKTIRIWYSNNGDPHGLITGPDGIRSVAFSPDGTRILSGSYDETARVWDAKTGKELMQLEGHNDEITSASFSPDGTHIATASYDHTARLWDAGKGTGLRELEGHGGNVNSVAFSPNILRIVSGSSDKTARQWDTRTGAKISELRGHGGPIYSAAFSPDGKYIITASSDETMRLWDAEAATEVKEFTGHQGFVWSVAFSPDGTRILSGSLDNTARVWDVKTATELMVLKGHAGYISGVAFSPDGERAVTSSYDRTARVWDLKKSAEVIKLSGHDRELSSVTFSPDGTQILTGSLDKTARIWDAHTGQELRILEGHEGEVTSVTFSPDGARILTGSRDYTARLWDAKTGAQLGILEGHDGPVLAVAFSKDGNRIATGSTDKRVRLWDAKTGQELVDHAKALLSRCLTPTQRKRFYLPPGPPSWCIKKEKWPFETQAWRDWFAAKRAGASSPLPEG